MSWQKMIPLIRIIYYSLFKECFMIPECSPIKETLFCALSVISLFTAKKKTNKSSEHSSVRANSLIFAAFCCLERNKNCSLLH